MVASPLTQERKDAGRTLIAKLDEDNVLVDAALWLYFPELEKWRLILFLPELVEDGPRAAYRAIQRTLSEVDIDPANLSLENVGLLRGSSEMLSRLRRVTTTRPGAKFADITLSDVTVSGLNIEAAYIYRLRRERPPRKPVAFSHPAEGEMMAEKRDPKVVERFLKSKGLRKVPKGKEIDHKVPLVDRGSDTVRNMQLLTEKQHADKTAREARARAAKKKTAKKKK